MPFSKCSFLDCCLSIFFSCCKTHDECYEAVNKADLCFFESAIYWKSYKRDNTCTGCGKYSVVVSRSYQLLCTRTRRASFNDGLLLFSYFFLESCPSQNVIIVRLGLEAEIPQNNDIYITLCVNILYAPVWYMFLGINE